MFRLSWLLSLFVALLAVIFTLINRERLAMWLSRDAVVAVRIAPVKTRSVPITMRIHGVLAPPKSREVVSQLAGRISEVRFKVGDAVPSGAVVAVIFPSEMAQRERDLSAALGTARKDLQAKESQLAESEKLAERTREFFKQDLIARRDVEKAEAATETARAQAELARARVAQQEAMLAQTQKIGQLRQIIAPISGVIARRFAEPGATIAAGSTILSIAGDSTLKFTAAIAQEIAGRLRVGLNAVVIIAGFPETKFDGSLTRLEPRSGSGAAVAEIEIQTNDSLPKIRAASAADALVRLDRSEEVLLVPRVAISESGGSNYLFKLSDGRAVRQEVELGAVEDDDVVIQRGISRTDAVILDDLRRLKPGMKVRASSALSALAR
jgi:RND family efflux transporter MFP subunit